MSTNKVIQYAHYNQAVPHKLRSQYGQPFTVAMEVDFLPDLLYGALRSNNVVALNIGIAKLNPNDTHFIKKVGREEALKKMTIRSFRIKRVINMDMYNMFVLHNDELNIFLRLSLRGDRPTPLLIGAFGG